ncbi:hypothetical protein [Halomarina oriensis]|uniref:Uncharacterized protein n=1 Tax=Halomarina oriensis TaxID=671145 RepID=A0A6B0GGW7_9EURY|nr:hypothetical protein [Halomarina oriensis]MWG32991.1 hypothetical protein [Halomarina oriensis]
MSGEFGEAVEAIVAIGFGGLILVMLAPHLGGYVSVDLAAWGVLYLLAALFGGIAFIMVAFRALVG